MIEKVAVCIPTQYKRKHFLKQLLESLKMQTFKDFRLFFVADISPAGKAKHNLIKKALIENPKYICMIDDDDILSSNYLEKVVGRLEQGDIDYCFTWGYLFGDPLREGYIRGKIQTKDEMYKWNEHPSWISARTEVFRQVNFDPNMSYPEDMDLWLRIIGEGFVGDVIEEQLYIKRWHEDSQMSNNYKENQ